MQNVIPKDSGTDRYLPWLLAIITFMAEIALAVALILNTVASNSKKQLNETITIEIPGNIDKANARALEIATSLSKLPIVVSARVVTKEEMSRLLSPILGESGLIEYLPLPQLVDVRLKWSAANDLASIVQVTKQILNEARIDDHKLRLIPAVRLIDWVTQVSIGIVMLFGGALCLTIIIATRATFLAQKPVFELLHLIGADDDAISSQFQRHALKSAIKGSLLGLASTSAVLFFFGKAIKDIDIPLITHLSLTMPQIIILGLLPIPMVALAVLTARLTVISSLTSVKWDKPSN